MSETPIQDLQRKLQGTAKTRTDIIQFVEDAMASGTLQPDDIKAWLQDGLTRYAVLEKDGVA